VPELIAPSLKITMNGSANQRVALKETMKALGKGGDAPAVLAATAILDGLWRS